MDALSKQRDRLWARVAESTDGALGFLPFWRPRPEPDGGVGAGCLSQFWPAPFTVDGTTFPSAEHFMMWRKATLFADSDTARRVLAARDPATAQALGRQVRGFIERTWTATRFPVVVEGNLAKFGAHPALRNFLLGTGDRVLVEASPVDLVWGAGLAADHPDIAVPGRWRGQNLLGFALMEVRDRLHGDGS
ncbi:NADAR family protein [Actinoplanes sp. NPDC049548]|uniref:NADAR family protein n=1 Tax=Actinoplanes sp. NPDC049548 TaxID=3155152 RepID=UPI00341A87A2